MPLLDRFEERRLRQKQAQRELDLREQRRSERRDDAMADERTRARRDAVREALAHDRNQLRRQELLEVRRFPPPAHPIERPETRAKKPRLPRDPPRRVIEVRRPAKPLIQHPQTERERVDQPRTERPKRKRPRIERLRIERPRIELPPVEHPHRARPRIEPRPRLRPIDHAASVPPPRQRFRITRHVIEREPIKREPIKREPIKREPIKREPIKREAIKREAIKREPIKRPLIKPEPIKSEPTQREPIKPKSITRPSVQRLPLLPIRRTPSKQVKTRPVVAARRRPAPLRERVQIRERRSREGRKQQQRRTVDQRQAQQHQRRQAVGRQQVLEAVRQAQARAARLAQRQADVAAQRQEERVAARRPIDSRLTSGVLSPPLAWLHVRGRQVLDDLDRPVLLRGVTVRWLERAEPIGNTFLAPVDDDDLALMQSWGATVVSVPIAQDLAIYGAGAASGEAYLQTLDATIGAAAEAGLYTIVQLSLLSSALPSDVDSGGRERFDPPLPNEQSLMLWGAIARRYSAEPAVIFDLFRSPHDPAAGDPTSQILPHFGWTLWRRWLLAMLGEVRRNHPRAVVMARGLARGRDLSGFPLTYRDGTTPSNVIYAAEVAVGDPRTVTDGLARVGASDPVAIAGWHATGQSTSGIEHLGAQFARHGWHWVAADWAGSDGALVDYQLAGLRPTPAGRAFQNAMAKPDPTSNLDHALAASGIGRTHLPAVKVETPSTQLKRDPFAPPGRPGNRWARFGDDGPIPDRARPKLLAALDLAYNLALQPAFAAVFARVVSGLTGKHLGLDACLDALNKMIINLAETTRDKRILDQLKQDAAAVKLDPLFQPPPAMSIPNGTGVWLREWQLKKDETVLAGTLLHESAHLAGAPADALAEIALEAIHNVGYPRR